VKKALLFVVLIIFLTASWWLLRDPGLPVHATRVTQPGSSRLSELLGGARDAGFPLVLEPREFRFPSDHGPHPEYRNEWWYATGNLDGDDGRRFGFELTLFRFALSASPPEDASAWRSNQVYIGHLALTDVDTGSFRVAQRYSRGALGLAGATADPVRVWLEDWEMSVPPSGDGAAAMPWHIRAAGDDFGLDLTLAPAKDPVLNGRDGLSQKSAEPGNASYYYSLTRLDAVGTVAAGGMSRAVSGSAWIDREWGSSALARNQQGWDWFALQLEDGTELMYYQLRLDDGSIDAMSSGTWVLEDGRSRRLEAGDVILEVLDHWDSPAGGRYPMGWRLAVPGIALDVRIRPVLESQELVTNVRYWEGAVDVDGSRGDNRVRGRGYVELTGYAD
jgi:predicted secreted hydrolase